jgi:hypothetical protein
MNDDKIGTVLFEPARLVASRSEEELREPRRLSLEGRKVEVVES